MAKKKEIKEKKEKKNILFKIKLFKINQKKKKNTQK
jgi:hypothetical protein